MKISIKTSGSINKKATIDELKLVLFKSMIKIHELAVLNCPVDTGRLRNSINISPNSPGYSKYTVSDGVKYGIDVEFGCFFKDTILIKTENGYKKLKDLKLGEKVWTGKKYKKIIQKECFEIGYLIKKIKIKTESNELEVTGDHPVWTTKGWKKARDLKKGDKIRKIW